MVAMKDLVVLVGMLLCLVLGAQAADSGTGIANPEGNKQDRGLSFGSRGLQWQIMTRKLFEDVCDGYYCDPDGSCEYLGMDCTCERSSNECSYMEPSDEPEFMEPSHEPEYKEPSQEPEYMEPSPKPQYNCQDFYCDVDGSCEYVQKWIDCICEPSLGKCMPR